MTGETSLEKSKMKEGFVIKDISPSTTLDNPIYTFHLELEK